MARTSRTGDKSNATKTREASSAKAAPLKTRSRKAQRQRTRASRPKSSISDLEKQIELQARELEAARQQQAASSDVFRILSASGGALKPAFEAIIQSAVDLCQARFGAVFRMEGDRLHFVADYNFGSAQRQLLEAEYPVIPSRGRASGRSILTRSIVQIPDTDADTDYTGGSAEQSGFRSLLAAPLLKGDQAIGSIVLYKAEAGTFPQQQVALLQHLAAQAVIAIENSRLFNEVQARTEELSAALERQTATGEVLRVIASSPTDVQRALQVICESACRLCNAYDAGLLLKVGDDLHFSAHCGPIPTGQAPRPINRQWVVGRSVTDKVPVQVSDFLSSEANEFPEGQRQSREQGHRCTLSVPLLREGAAIGAIALRRLEPVAFGDKQVALLQTFADQAVIAIENARLFNETREALERQTATSDVLKIISRSSVELEMVLDTLVQAVARLCRADQVYMFHLHHDLWHLIADYGLSTEARTFFQTNPFTPGRGSTSGRAALEGRAVSITDVLQDPEYTLGEGQAIAGYRSTLGVPLFRENTLIGVFSIVRTRVDPFTNKEIELASTFADQAVIAIENARLFEELRERQAELRVTFDNMGDGVAMFGPDKRLASWNRNLQEMLELADPFLNSRPSFAELFSHLAARGEFDSADLEAELSRSLDDTEREMRYERTRPDGRVIEVRRNSVPDGGFVLIYADITERKRAEETIRIARDAAEKALRDLQAAQDRLVQTEKLASLGQLTAGIAHEIKNPLNFINNFAALSAELIDEMNELFENAGLDERDRRAELDEIRKLLKGNLEKVVQHGKRADSIVKNMLLHSREGSGERRPAEINRLVEESLNLAYHGARAEKPGFNITIERDLDPEVGILDVYPQEMTRALLNLISNGFYAATRRMAEADGNFEPVLSAMTRKLGDTIEIRIRDNGTGIPPEVREKMFNPFFTTKPTGEGTGLGLSMTHDIIIKQHGGKIDVETEQGAFTEIIVSLPRGKSTTR